MLSISKQNLKLQAIQNKIVHKETKSFLHVKICCFMLIFLVSCTRSGSKLKEWKQSLPKLAMNKFEINDQYENEWMDENERLKGLKQCLHSSHFN